MTAQERVSGGVDAAHPALGFHVQTNTGEDGVTEIIVAGELDLANSSILREVVDMCCDRNGVKTLIVDVAELSFIDATGLDALWSAQETMRSSGGTLYLREPSQAVERILNVTKLGDEFAVLDGGG